MPTRAASHLSMGERPYRVPLLHLPLQEIIVELDSPEVSAHVPSAEPLQKRLTDFAELCRTARQAGVQHRTIREKCTGRLLAAIALPSASMKSVVADLPYSKKEILDLILDHEALTKAQLALRAHGAAVLSLKELGIWRSEMKFDPEFPVLVSQTNRIAREQVRIGNVIEGQIHLSASMNRKREVHATLLRRTAASIHAVAQKEAFARTQCLRALALLDVPPREIAFAMGRGVNEGRRARKAWADLRLPPGVILSWDRYRAELAIALLPVVHAELTFLPTAREAAAAYAKLAKEFHPRPAV